MYPQNDYQFEDTRVASVMKTERGWTVERADGWSFYVPSDSQIAPEEGMPARFYGKGIGFPVRGLFLAGVKVFYRTKEEEEERREIDLYGVDAADWLKRWDDGKSVWSIEMGGIGPGYEQCIQITATEILRHMLKTKCDTSAWDDPAKWTIDRECIEAACFDNETIHKLGLSAAQWGAALDLATFFYRDGPRTVMTAERLKDRHIQVQRTFPTID